MTVDGIVLVHGSNLSAACWGPVAEHLSLPAVAVDLPGRGSRPADIMAVTLDDCVTAVIDAAAQAGLGRFVLVGHSLGGVVITETACRYPDRVGGRVYVGALVPAPGACAADIVFGADLPVAKPRMPKEDRAKSFFATDMTEAQWADLWNQFVPESPLLWNARLSEVPDCTPVTFVSMTDDVGVPPGLAKQMIANLGVEVDHRVLSASHIVMVTRARELAQVINEFVNC
jgi:pimeloyl-ACP methyl ester carboxylesterase